MIEGFRTFFLVLLALISFVKCQSSAAFTSPVSGSNYPTGSQVIVNVAYSSNQPIAVTQTCGVRPPSIRAMTSNIPTSFDLPNGFSGSCTYSGSFVAPIISPPQNVSINVGNFARFTSPISGSSYTDNSVVTVNVAYISDQPITVTQTCGVRTPTTLPMISNRPTSFNLPNDFSGSCTYSGVFDNQTIPPPPNVSIYVDFALFTSPTSGSTYPINSAVTVNVAYSSNQPIAVTQTCGVAPPTNRAMISNTPTSFNLPNGFSGSCTYSGVFADPLISPPQNVVINVIGGIVTITSPSTSSRLAAGQTTSVTLQYNPAAIGLQSLVTLNCPNSGLPSTSAIVSGTNSYPFPIPQLFYGNCVFSVTNSGGYASGPNVFVVVTQTLVIDSPTAGQLIEYPNDWTTLVRTGYVNNIAVTINMTVSCTLSNVLMYYAIPSNQLTTILSNMNNVGTCAYRVTEAPNSYLNTGTSVTFSIKTGFTETITPSVIYSGIPFDIGLFTPQPFLNVLIVVNLNCSGTILNTTIIPGNQLVQKTLTPPLNSRTDCQINTNPSSANYIYFSAPVIIDNPSFKLPVNDTVYPENGSVLVALQDTAGYTAGNVTQNCGGTVEKLALNSNFEVAFNLPTGYIGACEYTAETDGPSFIYPAEIFVNYVLIFTQYPSIIAANIPFTIFLSSEISAATNVSLICQKGSLVVYTWASVSVNQAVSLTLPAGTSGSGQCILSTPESDQNYFKTQVPVLLIKSPFGGDLEPLTSEEINVFLKSVLITSRIY